MLPSPLVDSCEASRSASKAPSTATRPQGDSKRAYITHLTLQLNIPSDLIDQSDTSLYMGYKKYKAINAAIHTASKITWEVKKPTDTEITECFIAKSLFHNNLKQFKGVSDYPDMQKWLEKNKMHHLV